MKCFLKKLKSLFSCTSREVEERSDFRISEEWKEVLNNNPEMLDYYLNITDKMRDNVIERCIALTDRGYKFFDFLLIIMTVFSAITITVFSSDHISVFSFSLTVLFAIFCIITLIRLKTNKIQYKGYTPESIFTSEILEWLNNVYANKAHDYKFYELESLNKEIRNSIELNENIAKNLRCVKTYLLILLIITFAMTLCIIF